MPSPEFFLGLALIPAAAIAVCLVWAAYALATKAWQKLHVSMMSKVVIRNHPYDTGHRAKAALEFAGMVEKAPHFRMISGLGWLVFVARDYTAAGAKQAPAPKPPLDLFPDAGEH